VNRAAIFAREQIRAPLTLTLLIGIPALFVVSAAGALSDFADALGGSVAGHAAIALSAGWAAAFISGTLGFFEASSSHEADRRLALAGLGPRSVALSRLLASLTLALLASAAAFVALIIRVDLAHPFHALGAILGFAVLYLAVGVAIGSIIRAPLEGSLLVVFVFLLDAFAGPGMSDSPPAWAISQSAAKISIAAGVGAGSPREDWIRLGATVAAALAAAMLAFVLAARSRA
jgi:hypothetical protein